MTERRLEIEQADTGRYAVRIDGQDVSNVLTGLRMNLRAGHWPAVTLEPHVDAANFHGDALVAVPRALAELLVALGWTPPREDR